MITCTKCRVRKDDSMFRTRTKRGYVYKQHTCKACEAKAQMVRYNKVKNNEDFKEKNKSRVKDYAKANPEKLKKYRKENRTAKNKKYSEYRKRYWRKNEEQRAKHKIRAKRNHEHNRDELTDRYVISRLAYKSNLKKEDIPQELIEAKRAYIKLKRVILKNQNNNGNKTTHQNPE